MPIQRLNHAVLYVRDAQRSAAFYEEVLGFVRLIDGPRAVFMRACSISCVRMYSCRLMPAAAARRLYVRWTSSGMFRI